MAAHEESDLLHSVGEHLRSEDSVVAAFVFGSAAAGRVGPESDIDVGILFEAIRPRRR